MKKTGYVFPVEPDCLYCSGCDQDIEKPNNECSKTHIPREQRGDNNPVIHYGIIASGNKVVKDATVRDQLRDQFDAFCVETEAAGLMNHFPCLVIRGVCHYADRHKNDAWDRYAALTAAAYAKEFLSYITPVQATQVQTLCKALGT